MIGSSTHGLRVLLDTVPKTLNDSPVFISGTISHRTGLFGSDGSTAPHGGKFVSPPLTREIDQSSPSVAINGRSSAASPVRLAGSPSQLVGYGLSDETSSYISPALVRASAWNNVAQLPNVPSPLLIVESK